MRTESEVISEVLDYANKDLNVRSVIRTNLIPTRDYLFSYEFYFIITDINLYEDDAVFEKAFGKRILLFRGDRNYPNILEGIKGHLMVFKDGITIVINAITKVKFMEKYHGNCHSDNVWIGNTYVKIMDKDNILPRIEKLRDEQLVYYELPTKAIFDGTCQEYFWVLKTFAEYTLRRELPAAMFYLNNSVRDMLNRMIRWYISLMNRVPVEIGILDSYFEIHLKKDLFDLYKATYAKGDYVDIWRAFDNVVILFRSVGQNIADLMQFKYPIDVEGNMLEFIENLKLRSECK